MQKKHRVKWIYHWVRTLVKIVFFLWRIRVYRYFHQSISKKQPYIFISNHNSYLDPLVCISEIPVIFRPLAKSELSKIPFFGFIYNTMAVGVQRDKLSSKKKSFDELHNTLQKKCSVLIYPEGTFNVSNKPLIDFHNGAFKLAQETQIPIMPIVLKNVDKCLHHSSLSSFSPGKIQVHFLSPVYPEDFDTAQNMKDKCFEDMKTFILKKKE